MGTPHTKSREARDQQVNVRLTPAALDVIDEHRGAWTRSEYIRQAVAYSIKNGKRGPSPVPVEENEIRW